MMEVLKKLVYYDLYQQGEKIKLLHNNPLTIEKKDILELLDILADLADSIEDINSVNFRKILYIIGIIEYYGLASAFDLSLTPFYAILLTNIGTPISSKMLFGNIIDFDKMNYDIKSAYNYLNHELRSYSRLFGETNWILTSFQLQVLSSIEENRVIGISSDTSSGKSLIILLKIIDYINTREKLKVLYVVPTLSLETQVLNDFIEYGVSDFVSNNYIEDTEKQVVVQTFDKATFLIEECSFDIIIIDEIQNVSEFAETDEDRRWKLIDLLKILNEQNDYEKLILSGPYINSMFTFIKECMTNLRDEEIFVIESKLSPVANIQYYFTQRDEGVVFATSTPFNEIEASFIVEEGEGLLSIPEGLFKYNESTSPKVIGYISEIYKLIFGGNENTIMYIGAKTKGKDVLASLTEYNHNIPTGEHFDELIDYLIETVHIKYELLHMISKSGISYHNGSLPRHVRNVIEIAFKDGTLKGLITTSTLLQGVNMPIKNIIVKDMIYNGTPGRVERLDKYEHANLKGRAGRLLKDLVGRVYILSEKNIEDYVGKDEVEKTLNGKAVLTNEQIEFMTEEGILEDEFKTRLRDINIKNKVWSIFAQSESFDEGLKKVENYFIFDKTLENTEELKFIFDQVDELEIRTDSESKAYISSNRYWEIRELNELYKYVLNGGFNEHLGTIRLLTPKNLAQYSRKLSKVIEEIIVRYPISARSFSYKLFRKHLILNGEISNYMKGKIRYVATIGTKYARQYSYSNIIGKTQDESKINGISDILNEFRYYMLPLLKPVFDILGRQDEKYTKLIEHYEQGGYTPTYTVLRNMGFDRETSIRLVSKLPREKTNDVDYMLNNYKEIIRNHLTFWEKRMYQHLL